MPRKTNIAKFLKGIEILHEDRDILVINKPASMLTVGTDTEKERTAQHILTDYVRKGQVKSHKRVYTVHRLDKQTSGILIFAKSDETKRQLQDNWDKVEKKYLAVVHGHLQKKEDTITSYLTENAAQIVYSTPDRFKGKISHTKYRVLRETKSLSFLEVTLLTGRKNQIRVHMADIGHPIVGDRKYGDKTQPVRERMALHALSISFNHPYNGKRVFFEAEIPSYFSELIGKIEQR